MTKLELGLNPIWLIACVIIALGFSLFLYFRYKHLWPSPIQKVLFVIRGAIIFCALALLLNPILKQIINKEKASVVKVLIDNSSSLEKALEKDSAKYFEVLKGLKQNVPSGTEVEFFTLNGELDNLDSLSFDYPKTNLYENIKQLNDLSAGQNIQGVVLLSDGIINQGASLAGLNSKYPIHTVGVGDTTEKKDIAIKQLFVNRYTYKGNEFPVSVLVSSVGYKGRKVKVNLKVDNQVIESKEVQFSQNNDLKELEFKYISKKKGFLKVEAFVSTLEEELTANNNVKTRFVEVRESKQKIAIIAKSPHPDLKAIRTAIEKGDNYQVDVINLSLGQEIKKINDYGLFILHQLPCKRCSKNQTLEKVYASDASKWFIIGEQTDLIRFNKLSKSIQIDRSRQTDNVSGALNESFDLFNLKEFDFDWLRHAPPVKVPFARVKVKGESHVLLNQKIGSQENGRPLAVYGEREGIKEIVFLGEGLWKWRLFEYAENSNTDNLDGLLNKMLNLLDKTKEEKPFDVRMSKSEYLNTEKPIIRVISKNNVGELIYSNRIDLKITRNDSLKGTYSFNVSEASNSYELPYLEGGAYNYQASTEILGEKYTDFGSFVVNNWELEDKDLQANFDGLRELAKNTGGEFITVNNSNQFLQNLKSSQFKKEITSSEVEKPFNDLWFLLFILLVLASLEWILRKSYGDI